MFNTLNISCWHYLIFYMQCNNKHNIYRIQFYMHQMLTSLSVILIVFVLQQLKIVDIVKYVRKNNYWCALMIFAKKFIFFQSYYFRGFPQRYIINCRCFSAHILNFSNWIFYCDFLFGLTFNSSNQFCWKYVIFLKVKTNPKKLRFSAQPTKLFDSHKIPIIFKILKVLNFKI